MHAITNEDAERLDQLARYLAHGIEQKAAGAAVGYSASRVSQLMATEDFQELVDKHASEIVAQYMDVNSMYDTIERKALANLLDHAKFSKDPDLNFKLAMMSNRATRRGVLSQNNLPLDAKRGDGYVHLELSFNLIQKAQNGMVAQPVTVEGESREVDIATPGMVQKLLEGLPSEGERATRTVEHNNPADPLGLSSFFTPVA